MRGSKAKAIRRKVYSDNSQRTERKYFISAKSAKWWHDGTLQNVVGSLRALYQKAKRAA
jgi:hypothetical protein